MEVLAKFSVLLIVVSESFSKPVEHIERMMLRRRMDDNNGAASSYVYRSDNNGPPQIYYLTADDLNKNFHHHSSPLVYFESSPLKYSHKYTHPYAAAYPTNYYPPKPRSTLPFKPSPLIAEHIESAETPKDHSSSSSSSESQDTSDQDQSKSNNSEGGENFSIEKGQSHEDKYHKKHGKKSKSGYRWDYSDNFNNNNHKQWLTLNLISHFTVRKWDIRKVKQDDITIINLFYY